MGIFNKFLRLFTLTIIFSLSGLLSLVVFTILIVKRKNVGLSKKVMPIWLYLLFGLGVMIIQMKHPELVITTAMESLVCCLMYFTIENPNFKTPVIALAADAVTGAKEKYIGEGFVDYIAKTFNKEQIKQKLDIVFNNSDMLTKGEEEKSQVNNPIADQKQETEIIADKISNKVIDENYLLENGVNYKKGIELLGDLETYNDMLSDWFKESQNKF